MWETILWTPAFWTALADFEYIGLLARVAQAFRFTVPWNSTAWLEVSRVMPVLSRSCTREVFCVTADATDTCYSVACKALAAHGAVGVFRTRCRRTQMRAHRGVGSCRRTRWPSVVLFRRLEKLLVDSLLAWRDEAHYTVVSNRRLSAALLQQAHTYISPRLPISLVNDYLWRVCVAHGDCVQRRWHANFLVWKFDIHGLVAALRPLSHARVLRTHTKAARLCVSRPATPRPQVSRCI